MDSRANSQAVDSLLNYETVKILRKRGLRGEPLRPALTEMGRSGGSQSSVSRISQHRPSDHHRARRNRSHDSRRPRSGQSQHEPRRPRTGERLSDTTLHALALSRIRLPRDQALLGRHGEHVRSPEGPTCHRRSSPRAPTRHFAGRGSLYAPQLFLRRRPLLQDIDFTIAPQSTTAVVGPSGSGKSTLVRLLVRLYDPDAGAIVIDGQDIRGVTQSSLRHAIGVVPQDPVLFNDSLYVNIAYGRPARRGRRSKRRWNWRTSIVSFASLPKGYDTLVGERGLKLSGARSSESQSQGRF